VAHGADLPNGRVLDFSPCGSQILGVKRPLQALEDKEMAEVGSGAGSGRIVDLGLCLWNWEDRRDLTSASFMILKAHVATQIVSRRAVDQGQSRIGGNSPIEAGGKPASEVTDGEVHIAALNAQGYLDVPLCMFHRIADALADEQRERRGFLHRQE
jgi:hypothetical protein